MTIQISLKSIQEIISNLCSWNWKILKFFVDFLVYSTAFILSTSSILACSLTYHDSKRLTKWVFCPYTDFGICRFVTLCIKISNPLNIFAGIHAFHHISFILFDFLSWPCDKWEEGWELMTDLEWNSLTKIEEPNRVCNATSNHTTAHTQDFVKLHLL